MPRTTKIDQGHDRPASRDPEVLARMVEAGIDVARLNFSHGSADGRRTARGVRDAAGRANRQVAVLQTLPAQLQVGSFHGVVAFFPAVRPRSSSAPTAG